MVKKNARRGRKLNALIAMTLQTFPKKRGASVKEVRRALKANDIVCRKFTVKKSMKKLKRQHAVSMKKGRYVLTGLKLKSMTSKRKKYDSRRNNAAWKRSYRKKSKTISKKGKNLWPTCVQVHQKK